MTFPGELTDDERIAFRLVEKAQRRANEIGRDVRVLLALKILALDCAKAEAYVAGKPLVAVVAD